MLQLIQLCIHLRAYSLTRKLNLIQALRKGLKSAYTLIKGRTKNSYDLDNNNNSSTIIARKIIWTEILYSYIRTHVFNEILNFDMKKGAF
jgi:hypothetical protein